MISDVIHQETLVFGLSLLLGSLYAFFYDMIRAFRRALPHGILAVSVEDILFWLAVGFVTFGFSYIETEGIFRGYMIIGMVLGAVLYHQMLGRIVLSLFCKVFSMLINGIGFFGKQMRKMGCRIGHYLMEPWKKICQIPEKGIEFVKKRGYNVTKNRNKGK